MRLCLGYVMLYWLRGIALQMHFGALSTRKDTSRTQHTASDTKPQVHTAPPQRNPTA